MPDFATGLSATGIMVENVEPIQRVKIPIKCKSNTPHIAPFFVKCDILPTFHSSVELLPIAEICKFAIYHLCGISQNLRFVEPIESVKLPFKIKK